MRRRTDEENKEPLGPCITYAGWYCTWQFYSNAHTRSKWIELARVWTIFRTKYAIGSRFRDYGDHIWSDN